MGGPAWSCPVWGCLEWGGPAWEPTFRAFFPICFSLSRGLLVEFLWCFGRCPQLHSWSSLGHRMRATAALGEGSPGEEGFRDNLNVPNGLARLLARADKGRPCPLVTDGDPPYTPCCGKRVVILSKFPRLKAMLISSWSLMDQSGRMIQLAMKADTAADLGRLRQNSVVISARRALLRTRRRRYPIEVDVHKFMVAVSRTEVSCEVAPLQML